MADKGNKNIHFVYLTEEGKEKLNKEFFESVEELNNATNEFIDNYVKTIYDIHTFRVTGVTRYLEAGLPINVVMILTGHTNPNIMLNVYNKLTNEDKRRLLKSAELKIMFDNPSKLEENTDEFIKKEILPNYDENNPDKLKSILSKNYLFTPEVKKSSKSTAKVNSIEDIAKISPLNWIPVAGGICPNVACPDGREKKCSLCPYFITGIYFIDGVIFRANNAVLNFYQKVEEYNLSKDKSKVDDLELLMEEIYGWYEILNRIQKEQNQSIEKNFPIQNKKLIGAANIPNVLAYLENYYNAKILQTSPNVYGIKVLTIKAMKLALQDKNTDIQDIITDEKKAVDYIMNYYQNIKHSPKLLTDFLRKIGENTQIINNFNNNIGYNYK
ncbi:tyrosine-type recombinase/integrase [Lebetimonas sp. JH369]|uniref:tyrosine-type recombinase/integrase n=1 Tax=Lebetimonas sp. JH369 TaxID=990069 RepID=UPI000465DCF1